MFFLNIALSATSFELFLEMAVYSAGYSLTRRNSPFSKGLRCSLALVLVCALFPRAMSFIHVLLVDPKAHLTSIDATKLWMFLTVYVRRP